MYQNPQNRLELDNDMIYIRIYSLLSEKKSSCGIRFGANILLGKQATSSLFHSSIIVRNYEYFFGTKGIHRLDPQRGDEIMGMTSKMIYPVCELACSETRFLAYLDSIADGVFHRTKYNFLKWNCVEKGSPVASKQGDTIRSGYCGPSG